MLDLLLFGTSFILTKRISRREVSQLSSTLLSSRINTAEKLFLYDSRQGQPHENDFYCRDHEPLTNFDLKGSASSVTYQVSRTIYQTTIFISLFLLCLSLLEAAPASWLLIIDTPSSIIRLYRLLFWSLCLIVEIAVPSLLGAILSQIITRDETSLLLPGTSISCAHCPAATSLSSSISPNNKSNRSQNTGIFNFRPLLFLWKVAWIICRFFSAVVWYVLKKVAEILLPQSLLNLCRVSNIIDSREQSLRGHSNSVENTNEKSISFCSASKIMTVIVTLSSSFFLLESVSSIVINTNAGNGFQKSSSSTLSYLSFSLQRMVRNPNLLNYMIKMASGFGMIIASVLNGFGCASLPHSNLVGIFLKPTPPVILTKIEEEYHYALKSMEEKSVSFSGLVQQSSDTPRIKQISEEIKFLKHLVGDMKDDIDEMKYAQELALSARSLIGRIRVILGMIFSVVLVVRVVIAASSFLSGLEAKSTNEPKLRQKDPITILLLWLTGHNIVDDEQYNLFLQGTSLLLAGFLSMSQVRSFFRVIGAISRKFRRTFDVFLVDPTTSLKIGSSTLLTENQAKWALIIKSLHLALLSFAMGCYFLSCVIVVKSTLPIEYRSSFLAAIGKFDFAYNSAVLNITFLASTCVSAVILGFLFGIQRNNCGRYQNEFILGSTGSKESSAHTA